MHKIIIDVGGPRRVRLAPHRFGQRGNLIVVEHDDGDRLDLHLTDRELRTLVEAATRRLSHRQASRAYIEAVS